jgi:hypothetical protein
MTHAIHRVTGFELAGPFTLQVMFEDGRSRTIDFRPVLKGEIFGPLRDRQLFERVTLDAEARTLVWPNGADFDPATLYEWPDIADAFAVMAAGWSETETSGADDSPGPA